MQFPNLLHWTNKKKDEEKIHVWFVQTSSTILMPNLDPGRKTQLNRTSFDQLTHRWQKYSDWKRFFVSPGISFVWEKRNKWRDFPIDFDEREKQSKCYMMICEESQTKSYLYRGQIMTFITCSIRWRWKLTEELQHCLRNENMTYWKESQHW